MVIRVTFWGGPRDGETLAQSEVPPLELSLSGTMDKYVLQTDKFLNAFIYQYVRST